MVTAGSPMEVAVVGTIKHVEPIKHVLGCVTVHHVQKNDDPHPMSNIDQLLQLLRESVAGRSGEKACDLVTEAAIVGVLHDGHQLNAVITEPLDPGEHIVGEFPVGRHLGILAADANMSLVDPETRALLGPLVPPDVLFLGVVVNRFVHKGLLFLDNTLDPCRDAINHLARREGHGHLDLAVVRNSLLAVDIRKEDLPLAKISLPAGVGMTVPAIKVTDQMHGNRVRSILAEHDTTINSVEAHELITTRELLKAAFMFLDLVAEPFVVMVSVSDARVEWGEIGIQLQKVGSIRGSHIGMLSS
eukprot:Colp12_sorted_trinity150504_noHs@6786